MSQQHIKNIEISQCIEFFKENHNILRTQDYQTCFPYCNRLLDYAVQEQSDYLYSLAYFYLMEYYIMDNDHHNTILCAIEGIKYQQRVNDYELMARSYNILGLFTEARGDYTKAAEHWLDCIDLCNTHHLHYVHCMAVANLAGEFRHTGNYERALYFYDEAEKYYHKSTTSSEQYNSYIFILCNKGYTLLNLNLIEKANQCRTVLTDFIDHIAEEGFPYPRFVVFTFLAALEHYNDNIDKMTYYMTLAKEDFHSTDNYMGFMDDIKVYISLHQALNHREQVIELLDYYFKKCEKDNAPFGIFSYFLEQKIYFALQLNDTDTYVRLTRQFMKMYKQSKAVLADTLLRAEELHREYSRIQKQQYELHLLNEELLMQSQHDTLTGLPNRAFLNSHAEETLTLALKNQTTFGIEIIDIDFFKQLNDTFGHLSGDRFLSQFAELLQQLTHEYENVFVARYGGDEFVVVYYGKTDAEILEIMESLKQRCTSIRLPSKLLGVDYDYDYLTLSQGCCNQVPVPINRIWDFLSHADEALYDIKRFTKNHYKLINIYPSESSSTQKQ